MMERSRRSSSRDVPTAVAEPAAELVAAPGVAHQAPGNPYAPTLLGATGPGLRPTGALRQVLEHLLAVGKLPGGQLRGRRNLERQRTLRPGLAPGTGSFSASSKALEADGLTGADVAARLARR